MTFPLDPAFEMSPMALLSRVFDPEGAASKFPDVFGRLTPALIRTDPLADEVVRIYAERPAHELHGGVLKACSGDASVAEPLRALVEEGRSLMEGVDFERLKRAGAVFFRAGPLGGLTLGARSLAYGYASPVGNKPLAFTGALENKAEARLAETSRFVAAVCTSGGLTPHSATQSAAEGFRLAVHVRLMHAKVRAMAWDDPRWRRDKWGLPINQHDMLATILLFGVVFVDGLLHLGLAVSDEEADDYQYLWNQVGKLLGVEEGLLPRGAKEARRMAMFVRETQGPPDEDSRALVQALLNAPLRRATTPTELRLARAHTEFGRHLCRSMLDPQTAQQLGLGGGGEAEFVKRLRGTMRVLEKMRMRVPPLDELVRAVGASYWARNGQGAGDESGGFSPPEQLAGQLR